MAELHGQQLIFTRVEPAYSPSNKSGYQVVYHSPGLPTNIVSGCEQRVNSFRPPDAAMTRYQFFALDDFVILTHTIQIQTIPHINDRDGRWGIYLAHALLFKKGDFAKACANNPFEIFDRYEFLRDSETLIQSYNQQQGVERPCRLTFDTERHQDIDQRWLQKLPELVELTYRTDTLKKQNQYLLCYGNPAEILKTLRTIFYVAPSAQRVDCSFDTVVPSGKASSLGLQWWAVGVTEYESGGIVNLNCRSAQISGFELKLSEDDFYLDWLRKHLAHNSTTVFEQIPTIQDLARSFRENRPLSRQIADLTAYRSFMAQFETRIEQRLYDVYRAFLNENLTTAILKDFLANGGIPEILDTAATQRIRRGELSRQIRVWLVNQAPKFSALKKGDWKNLAEVAQKENDSVLMFWSAAYLQDEKMQTQALAHMNPSEFEAACELLFKPFGLSLYLHTVHIQRWIQLLVEHEQLYPDDDWVALVLPAIQANAGQFLSELTARVGSLDKKLLQQLEKAIQKRLDIAPEFREAVQARHEQLRNQPTNRLEDLKQWLFEDISKKQKK